MRSSHREVHPLWIQRKGVARSPGETIPVIYPTAPATLPPARTLDSTGGGDLFISGNLGRFPDTKRSLKLPDHILALLLVSDCSRGGVVIHTKSGLHWVIQTALCLHPAPLPASEEVAKPEWGAVISSRGQSRTRTLSPHQEPLDH